MFIIAVSADDAVSIDLEKSGITLDSVEKDAAYILQELLEYPAELSVYLCSAAEMQQLNNQYRGRDRATDVLAFSQLEQGAADSPQSDQSLLGDVVICLDVLREQAADFGHSETQELRRLLIHGILHLVGYDHEKDPEQELIMKQQEKRILQSMGYTIAE